MHTLFHLLTLILALLVLQAASTPALADGHRKHKHEKRHDHDKHDNDDDDDDDEDHEKLEKDAYNFYKKHAPVAGELIEFLEKRGEEEYAMELKEELFDRYIEFLERKEEEPEEAHRHMVIEVNELQAMLLGLKIQELKEKKDSKEAQDTAKKLQGELKTHLGYLFDRRIALEERELKHVDHEAEELRARIKARSTHKDKIIDRRIRQLTGQDDHLDW